MPVVIAVVGAIIGALFFILRMRNAANAGADLLDMANDVRLAARRFGFRRQANLHPAESIEEPDIAIAGIASAFLELDDLPTADQREALSWELTKVLGQSKQDADELCILGRWMVSECGGAEPAITRLSRKLYRLDAASFTPLLSVISGTLSKGDGGLNDKQTSALDDVKRAFRIKG